MAQRPTTHYERKAGHPNVIVVGVDEVGRGCLAGPVVAGAVALPADCTAGSFPWLAEVTDSKLIDEETRERLAPLIRSWVKGWGIGSASVEEIDSVNILRASHLAMVRAVEDCAARMGVAPSHLLIDGHIIPRDLPCGATAIVKGDLRCLSVACAAILAKVHRDTQMRELDGVHPGYGFAAHKGYGTPAHQAALRALGVTVIHRRSFAPVAAIISSGRIGGAAARP